MSNLAISEAKMPYVTFGVRAVEDRNSLLKEGVYGSKDVIFAFVTPAGSRDRYEYIAEEWFANLRQSVREERFPQLWLDHIQARFRAWKENEEMPVLGTPLKNWPVISPGQLSTCLTFGVLSVESLAEANEETIGRLGMGGRVLVDRAKDFLKAKEPAKLAGQMEALRSEFSELKAQNANLVAKNEELQRLVDQLKAGGTPSTTPETKAPGFMDD